MLRLACPKCGTVNEVLEPIGDSTFECGHCGQLLLGGRQSALRLVQCYVCGKPFREDQAERREVYIGKTQGSVGGVILLHGQIGFGGGAGSGRITGIQTLCPKCAAEHDEKKIRLKQAQEAYDRHTRRFFALIGILILAGLILFVLIAVMTGRG